MKEATRLGARLKEALQASGIVAMPIQRRRALFQVLARAIVGQQLSAKVAARLWERIEEGARAKNLPLPLFMEERGVQGLRALGLSSSKGTFLLDLCVAKDGGHLGARRIRQMAHAERQNHLTQIRGIGPWTVDMVGIFYCHDHDIWPQGDLAVRQTMHRLSGHEEAELPQLVESFKPYRSYLALQMWKLKNARPA